MESMSFNTPEELQVALGGRMRRLRLSRNMDQLATAKKAGVSEKALRNLEAGRGSSVETLLRVLKALDYLQGIEALAPEVTINPLTMLRKSSLRRRVRSPRKQAKDNP